MNVFFAIIVPGTTVIKLLKNNLITEVPGTINAIWGVLL
jgi:hypothetical protein